MNKSDVSKPLIIIQSNDHHIETEVTEFDLHKINTDVDVSIQIKALNNNIYKAKVSSIDSNPIESIAESSNKVSKYKVIVDIPVEIKNERTGYHVQITFGNIDSNIYIDKRHVIVDPVTNEKKVWLINSDNKAIKKEIEIEDMGDKYLIKSGINKGDYIILYYIRSTRRF